MEKLIIIACVALVLGIIAFGAYQLRKLRSRWADLKNANVHEKDSDRIVHVYCVEEGYVRQRSRIWLLTIMASAAVVLLGFGSAYYLHHKDVWAIERAEKAQEKTLEAAEAEKIEKKILMDFQNIKIMKNFSFDNLLLWFWPIVLVISFFYTLASAIYEEKKANDIKKELDAIKKDFEDLKKAYYAFNKKYHE